MSPVPCINYFEYQDGVIAVDSGYWRERCAAIYLVEDDDEVAIIETGTNSSVARILEVLARRGWAPEQVRYVIVTHVHLDHAGGAGTLMQHLPQAQFLVHPRGARHMIDPARLEASVRMVYGDEVYERDYGTLVPIATQRVQEMHDGDTARLGSRQFTFRDTPGHAKHHFCIWDDRSRGWFTGDTFGLSYRETDTGRGAFIFPTTTPIQFDPEALRQSIRLLADADPRWVYLTHFGRVGDVQRLAQDMLAAVDALVDIAMQHRNSAERTRLIEDDQLGWVTESARRHGVSIGDPALREVLRGDVVLNTQGIEYWLDHVAD
jgi:glyoxylase-like metal-dependent hydrolase (beta-lactamase superfamily II)